MKLSPGNQNVECAMKTRIKSLLPLLLLLALPATVRAQFTFTTNNGAITITGYTGPGGSVTIPDTIGGLPVISIGTQALYNNESLTNVMIGTNVTNVGIGAFAGCSSLTAITVNSNNQAYTSLTGVLFNQSQTTLIEYPGGLRGNYTIPNSVSSIGTSAFALCTNLTSITIPNGVTNVGPAAFFHCINLTSVTLSDSTTTIGYNAFNQCFNLANITIPDNVTSIGEWAFEECYNLTNALIGKSVTSIGMDAFLSCTKLVSADIPNSVTSIGDDGFYDCTSLTKVTIPNSVTNLGADVFGNCTNLTSVLIGNSFLGSFEFSSCSSLTNITIGAYVTSIADAAFYACHNLMGVYFLGNPLASITTAETPTTHTCSAVITKRPSITCRGPRTGDRRLPVDQLFYGTHGRRRVVAALVCGPIDLGSPSPEPAIWLSSWKPARTWRIALGLP